MGSKGKSGGTGLTAGVMGSMVKKESAESIASREAANRQPVGVGAKEGYRANDSWRRRTLMDQVSPRPSNGGQTLLG